MPALMCLPSLPGKEPFTEVADEIPPGLRFRPNAFELLLYLREKLEGWPLTCGDDIKVADVYGCHPQIIIDQHATGEDQGCYVFSSTKRRCGNKPDRSNGDGRWQTTRGERPIYHLGEGGQNAVLGHKTSLAYKDGNEVQTKWLMDEYVLKEFRDCAKAGDTTKRKRGEHGKLGNQMLDRWVICYVHLSPVKRSSYSPWPVEDEGDMHTMSTEGEHLEDHQLMLPAPQKGPLLP